MSSEEQQGCALVVPICETARLEMERDQIARTLGDLAEDLQDLREKVRRGEAKKTEGGTTLADLRYWLKALRETEAELDEIRRRDIGIAGDWGLDLHAAQFEVGCRLDRLKAEFDQD